MKKLILGLALFLVGCAISAQANEFLDRQSGATEYMIANGDGTFRAFLDENFNGNLYLYGEPLATYRPSSFRPGHP